MRKTAVESGHRTTVAESVWILHRRTRLSPRVPVPGPGTRGVSRVPRLSP
jgi:hypothetical protein